MRPALVCLDIDGTLTDGIGGPVLDGAVETVRWLRERVAVRLVTNATSRPHGWLCRELATQELLADPKELVTPAMTARRILSDRGHASGMLLIDAAVQADFEWFDERPDGAAVLLGSDLHLATIAALQPAFRRILEGATLYTLQSNRYYRYHGQLVTDIGPVAALLGYAAGVEAETLGKPSPLVFDALAAELAIDRTAILMVGDDAEFDVAGPIRLGLGGALVKTGKYRPGDEERAGPSALVLESVAHLPAALERSAG